jgi:predicted component of type VI protein secretion system
MVLKYRKADGSIMEFELGDRPITIGRSGDADLVLLDEKASRLHCGIHMTDRGVEIRDLKSKNGTYVNAERIESHLLQTGDRIRIGSTLISLESGEGKGPETVLREVADEMAAGKGYTTILREIMADVKDAKPATPVVPTAPKGTSIKLAPPPKPVSLKPQTASAAPAPDTASAPKPATPKPYVPGGPRPGMPGGPKPVFRVKINKPAPPAGPTTPPAKT